MPLKAPSILSKKNLELSDLVELLSLSDGEETEALLKHAYAVKEKTVGKVVYFRGLIEFSNICTKNCHYCGIRKDNPDFHRYMMDENEIVEAAMFAHKHRYGSIVLQSGERSDDDFIGLVKRVLKAVKHKTNSELGITLCIGEQSEETYRDLFAAGAHRYLLRIETSDNELYRKIHPQDHRFDERLKCLKLIKTIGYQTGTGVMIGLPFQTIEHLAKDLLFFRDMDVDMVGMGPYIEHESTPLYSEAGSLLTKEQRFNLTLKMISLLRILMPDINMASTTALQTLDPIGREKGLLAGANIIMPNITPVKYRKDYLLYEDKPCLDDDSEHCKNCLENRIAFIGETIGYQAWGDSKHFTARKV